MKILWRKCGVVIFWALWPVWVIYFRFTQTRSRVVVVHENEVLLVQGWLGCRREFSLPGGGAKRHESPAQSAVRELEEETGISVVERSLKRIGFYRHNRYGLKYQARIFSVELSIKPELSIRKPEIIEARWANLDEVFSLPLDEDAVYALERYRPVEQGRLL